ncbi:MAG: efflux RND transporter periplasmic adaptor subunit [Treponema sp.]|nr:efflux RND transporter periplasmic adaptor subunit [Spirochaetales bacterium]MEE1181549.1 efflux RND transporter periplasmic adaptor subunit [Treponema sp.]
MNKINRKSLVILLCCLAVLGIAFFLIKAGPAKKNNPGFGPGAKGGRGAPAENIVTVRTETAEKKVLHDYVNTNGEIESKVSVDVFPDIGGKLYKSFVSLGSTVKKGDALAEIDPSEPGAYYTHSGVFAPVSGTIIATVLDTGTKVTTQSVITTIGDVSDLQLKVKIVERYVANIKPGLKAKVKLTAYDDEVFDATVAKVSPVLDSSSRTKEVILDFDRKDSRINAGMFANVKLFTVDYSGKVAVPSSCIVTKGKHNYVFAVSKDGKAAVKKEITLGKSVDDLVQVEGIEEGERVVVEGMSVLTDGSLIREIK